MTGSEVQQTVHYLPMTHCRPPPRCVCPAQIPLLGRHQISDGSSGCRKVPVSPLIFCEPWGIVPTSALRDGAFVKQADMRRSQPSQPHQARLANAATAPPAGGLSDLHTGASRPPACTSRPSGYHVPQGPKVSILSLRQWRWHPSSTVQQATRRQTSGGSVPGSIQAIPARVWLGFGCCCITSVKHASATACEVLSPATVS